MDSETSTAMLTIAFAAVMVVFGFIFVNQRQQEEAARLLRSVALPQVHAVGGYSKRDGSSTIGHALQHHEGVASNR